MARVDLHTHTRYSPDALTTPQQFVARCGRAGLSHVAVTDHSGVEGAYAVAAAAPCQVIIGQEVRTQEGDLIGLFLKESIPRGLPAAEAAAHIHRQGGLVVAPHPFDRLRPSLGEATLRALGPALDALEGHNGRTLWRRFDRRARRYAAAAGLPCTLGSDAHAALELGRSYLNLPDFEGPQELLRALREGEAHPAPRAPWLIPCSGYALARRLLGRRSAPPARANGGGQ